MFENVCCFFAIFSGFLNMSLYHMFWSIYGFCLQQPNWDCLLLVHSFSVSQSLSVISRNLCKQQNSRNSQKMADVGKWNCVQVYLLHVQNWIPSHFGNEVHLNIFRCIFWSSNWNIQRNWQAKMVLLVNFKVWSKFHLWNSVSLFCGKKCDGQR